MDNRGGEQPLAKKAYVVISKNHGTNELEGIELAIRDSMRAVGEEGGYRIAIADTIDGADVVIAEPDRGDQQVMMRIGHALLRHVDSSVVPAMNTIRIAALTLWSVSVACGSAVHTRDVPLGPGPFEGLDGARLGEGVIFENDIDSSRCFPLELNDRTEAWLANAYTMPDRILVRRCELDVDNAPPGVNPGGKWGWRRPVWDRMLVETTGALRFVSLDLPRWTFMANPAFCDQSVAYWGFDDMDDGIRSMLRPTVFDFVTGTVVQVGTIGPAELRTDFEGFLSPPVWDATCGSVEFDGQPVGEGRSTFSVKQSR